MRSLEQMSTAAQLLPSTTPDTEKKQLRQKGDGPESKECRKQPPQVPPSMLGLRVSFTARERSGRGSRCRTKDIFLGNRKRGLQVEHRDC